MYAITGITGRVGGAIAENLLAQGEKLRAIVRNPEKAARWKERGAEVAVADVDDPNALQIPTNGPVTSDLDRMLYLRTATGSGQRTLAPTPGVAGFIVQ